MNTKQTTKQMKHIIKLTLTAILLFGSGHILGQEQEIDYTILSENATYLGQTIETTSTITKTGNLVTWEQINNGFSETLGYTVTNSFGNWDPETSQGQLTYDLTGENTQCSLVVFGQGNDLSATLTYILEGNEEEQYIFDVNAIIYQ